MKELDYFRDIEELPSAPICNLILNGYLVLDEFLMSTILELIINKTLKVDNDILFYNKENNLTNYQFDVLNLLFKSSNKYFISETKMIRNQVDFTRKVEYKCESKEYVDLFNLLKNESENKNISIAQIYTKAFNRLKKNKNIIYKEKSKNPFLFINNYEGKLEFVSMCNTSKIQREILLYNFNNLNKFNNCSIPLKNIKNLYINNLDFRKVNNLKMYSERNLLYELYEAGIFKKDLKTLTKKGKEIKEKILALKNFLLEYSLLNEKEFSDYIIWENYLTYATALGLCRKVEKIAEKEYTIQIDDLIDCIKRF